MAFDCNTAGSFGIAISPRIDASYKGNGVFNRVYFELEKDWIVYRSNYVEFYSSNTATQQLEFGGSLPSGTYWVTGVLQNIQLNSSCRDSVYAKYSCLMSTINVTEFSSPQKMMNIEYNCQLADTLGLLNYNVFSSLKAAEYVYNAFLIANTDRHLIVGDTALACSLLTYDPSDPSGSVNYIYNYKQYGNEMFLCGIKGFKNKLGDPVDILGNSIISKDTINFPPSCSTGSLIAVKSCIDYAATQYDANFNDLVTSVTVHELAHQRGIYRHHDDFANPPKPFCVMDRYPVYPSFNCYSNPHFCDECISKIKNISW